MTEAQLFPYALAVCGVLSTTVAALLVYIFVGQQRNIMRIEESLHAILGSTVGKSEFVVSLERVNVRVDEIHEDIADLHIKIVRLETKCENFNHA